MLNAKKMLFANQVKPLRPQDVFATSLYTGNGGSQFVATGIGKQASGLTWIKRRSGGEAHYLFDDSRGINHLKSNARDAEGPAAFNGWNGSGFGVGPNLSQSDVAYVAWSWREQKKFMVKVAYTGNGAAGRQIPHGLDAVPGMILVKARSSAADWPVYHRGLAAPATDILLLNDPSGQLDISSAFGALPTATTFTVGTNAGTNTSDVQYIAYLFAQNADLIDCGSYVGNNSYSGPSVTCGKGWTPQLLFIKAASGYGDWAIFDTRRGLGPGADKFLYANQNAQEDNGGSLDFFDLTSTGFKLIAPWGTANGNNKYIYLAIRSPT